MLSSKSFSSCQRKLFCFYLDYTLNMDAEIEFLRDQGKGKPGRIMPVCQVYLTATWPTYTGL